MVDIKLENKISTLVNIYAPNEDKPTFLQNVRLNVLDLIDIWRCFNPEAKRFTWRRRKPDIHCRLDIFFDPL